MQLFTSTCIKNAGPEISRSCAGGATRAGPVPRRETAAIHVAGYSPRGRGSCTSRSHYRKTHIGTDSSLLLKLAGYLLVTGVLAACAAYTPQQIERDVALWYPYHFRIDGVQYRIRIPPGAMIIRHPVTDIDARSVEDYRIAAAFGFDFGRGSYNDIAQVRIRVSVSRIDDGIVCSGQDIGFGECLLLDSRVSVQGNVNEYLELGGLQWFHEAGSHEWWDTYSILLGNDLYLSVEAYYQDDLVERPGMLADRRKLVEEIVGTVQKLN